MIDDRYLKLFQVSREVIRQEADWVKRRMAWLGEVQGLFAATYGLLFQAASGQLLQLAALLMGVVALAGLISSIFIYFGIMSASGAIKSITAQWNRIVPEDVRAGLPVIRVQEPWLSLGKLSTEGVCFVFALMWVLFLGVAVALFVKGPEFNIMELIVG